MIMKICSMDYKMTIEVGNSDILYSIYSTLCVRLSEIKKNIPLVYQFLKDGECTTENAIETARQFNLLRDELSKYAPEEAVYDMHDLQKQAPWKGKISKVVTSCANLYTTSDGQDLLFEIVKILCYADIAKTSIIIE